MFGQKGRQWLADLSLDPVAGTLVDALDQLIDQASQEVQQRAEGDLQAQLLRTIPGVGYFTTLPLAAEMGDVTRFPTLTPRVHSSGGAMHTSRITRQGSAYPRWILTEASQWAVRLSPSFGDLFRKQLAQRGLQRP